VAPLDAATLQGALAQLVEAEVVAQRGMPPQLCYSPPLADAALAQVEER
jgi:hypothetical protein